MDTAHVVFGLDPAWVAVVLLVLSYALIISERLNRSIIALLGGGMMILTGVLNQTEAIRGIDFNTIALLTGMMVLVSIARRSGLFEYVAIWSAKRGRAEPWAILAILSLSTALLSAFLDNVTTVLLIAPVTIVIARELVVPAYPFLFSEIFASNIGGTGTLIGDPPNIIIGPAAHFSFNDFVENLAPIVIVVLIAQTAAMYLIWGRRMSAAREARARVMALDERAMITDRPLLAVSLVVIGAVVAALVSAAPLHLEPGTIAMLGAAVLMLCHNIEHHREKEKQTLRVIETFNEVDWITIFFFVGLFIIVHGVDVAGVIATAAEKLLAVTGGDRALTVSAVLWGAALMTAIVDNIPLVATMVPLIKQLAPHLGGPAAAAPLWWALSLGACLGGNGTLIGASANLAVAGIAERHGVPFTFGTYMRHAFGLMLLSIGLCQVYIWIRYL
ncbi:MAG TPA: ArsB/NhaD family transporter [Stellaceae bacterium]|nr:ArsB/NhaD family transporter [Stellaceae bacterium]